MFTQITTLLKCNRHFVPLIFKIVSFKGQYFSTHTYTLLLLHKEVFVDHHCSQQVSNMWSIVILIKWYFLSLTWNPGPSMVTEATSLPTLPQRLPCHFGSAVYLLSNLSLNIVRSLSVINSHILFELKNRLVWCRSYFTPELFWCEASWGRWSRVQLE